MRIAMVSEHASPLAVLGGVDAGGQNVHVAALALAMARRGADVVVHTRRDAVALAGLAQQARAAEEQVNRHLKLQVQSLQRPQRIEKIARTQLRMVQPGPNDAVVLERVRPADPPDRSIVALR